ncbi:MAG: DUF1588 domain-containing protein [Halieaceae bacterium]|jgi:mono/diheme cytochrome c family protein
MTSGRGVSMLLRARAALLTSIALSVGISPNALAYSGLTGKVSSLLCQTRIAAAGSQEDYARNLYAAADPVVQQRCIGCHIENGIAPNAGAKLSLKSANTEEHQALNHESFQTLIALRSPQYVLSKAMGSAHGGGSVLSAFSDEYQALSDYVSSLDTVLACNRSSDLKGSANAEAAVWRGVGFSSPAETYRRAAIVIGGTVPNAEQLDSVASGVRSLNEALDDLMQGEGFHDFLITGANDQLLTDAFMNGLFPVQAWSSFFPRVAEINEQLFEAVGGEERYHNNEKWELWKAQNYGHARAPTELIAYVVENDLSYKEVLTADFEMMTPLTGDLFDSDIKWAEPIVYDGNYTDFHMQFRPGVNAGQKWFEDGPMICVPVQSGDCYPEYWEGLIKPHAGVLSTLAFLQRYPTTETNRNRARARWTYKFFLGVDIEASAARTTDPVALADTNNPTMNNPACTVCHQSMDPVAGAFQNYDELGFYRPHWDSDPNNPAYRNALPSNYKYGDGSEWEPGESWFRDMRDPGFNGRLAPYSETSLAWLGRQIANDPRFAVGTVEFWWPAVMGHEVLRAPEDPSLPGYGDKLLAFNLQRSEIGRLATTFLQSNFSLKVLLREMVQSKWFNAVAMPEDHPYSSVLDTAGVGARRLLTPEQLQAKTRALLGFAVQYKVGDWILPEVETYLSLNRVAMGGIDSYQVQSRARALSAIGSVVSATHGAAAACTVSQVDPLLLDGERLLLNDIDFREPIADTVELRDVLSRLYQALHGKSHASNSAAVDLVVDLLIEAYEFFEVDENRFCYETPALWDSESDRDQLIRFAREQGHLAEDPSRTPTEVEHKNTGAWRLALDFLFTHYDYVHE